jgi:hypothetical protein
VVDHVDALIKKKLEIEACGKELLNENIETNNRIQLTQALNHHVGLMTMFVR